MKNRKLWLAIGLLAIPALVWAATKFSDFATQTVPDASNDYIVGYRSGTPNTNWQMTRASFFTMQNETIVWEGATADDFELTLAAPDPNADHTVTLPEATGTLVIESYGEMYEDNDPNGTDIAMATGGTYYGWVSATADNLSGAGYVTFVNDPNWDHLLIGANGGGTYMVSAPVSFSGSPSTEFRCSVFNNDTEITGIGFRRKLGAGGDVGSAMMGGIHALVANDEVSVRCTAVGNSKTLTIRFANLSIARIGK